MANSVAPNPGGEFKRPWTLPDRLRVPTFVGINLTVLLALGIGAGLNPSSSPRFVYAQLLTLLCASPVLSIRRVNGSWFLLGVYLAIFFNYFGLPDVMGALIGRGGAPGAPLVTPAEAIILISGGLFTAGYHLGVKFLGSGQGASTVVKDWPLGTLLAVGLAFWIVGTLSLGYWQTYVITDRSNASLMRNLQSVGPWLTTVFMMGQLIQPLGILILAYCYSRFRRSGLLGLILLVTLVQVVLGFVADYKGEAMAAGILVIMTKSYVDGRAPVAWLAGGVLFVTLVFPVFQFYRLEVRGERGVTSEQALANIVKTLELSLQAQERAESGFANRAGQVQSFWERSSLKPSVELIVARVGVDKPYKMGETLTPIPAAFIPKILWPDKPSLAVGQVFNREFHIGEVEDTFISPSHIGEIYWNFGWSGVVVCWPLIGLLLGAIGARCSADPRPTLTRLLIIVVTIYAFGIGSEGSIAVAYVPWLRSMAAIGLLHMIFARPVRWAVAASPTKGSPLRFQNLLT